MTRKVGGVLEPKVIRLLTPISPEGHSHSGGDTYVRLLRFSIILGDVVFLSKMRDDVVDLDNKLFQLEFSHWFH